MPNTDHQDGGDRDRERQRVETSAAAELVRNEVVAMHAFLEQWFCGAANNEDDVFARGFARRFDPGFVRVSPAGEVVPLAQVIRAVRGAHGRSPEFRLQIRSVVLRRELDGLFVATYEEWQRSNPNNGRISTVLLQTDRVAPGGLAWLHLHECWLPEAVVAAERFEF
jgi:hypothetical protein